MVGASLATQHWSGKSEGCGYIASMLMLGGFGGHAPRKNIKIMHLSFVSLIAPHTGIGEDNRGFDLVILSNSPLLEYAACYIKSPLEPQQCLYRN